MSGFWLKMSALAVPVLLCACGAPSPAEPARRGDATDAVKSASEQDPATDVGSNDAQPDMIADTAPEEAPTAAISTSSATIRYDGVDYPLQFPTEFTEAPVCDYFFGFSRTAILTASTTPNAKIGPRFIFRSGVPIDGAPAYGFAFWPDFDPADGENFDSLLAPVHFTLLDKGDGIVGYEDDEDYQAGDLFNGNGLTVEGSHLVYEGPVAADGQDMIRIDMTYCPDEN